MSLDEKENKSKSSRQYVDHFNHDHETFQTDKSIVLDQNKSYLYRVYVMYHIIGILVAACANYRLFFASINSQQNPSYPAINK